jgi:magnesium chelatase subunit I
MNFNYSNINTLGALKASGYKSKSIKQELRENLVEALRQKKTLFKGILGFEDTVIPDLQRAILSFS